MNNCQTFYHIKIFCEYSKVTGAKLCFMWPHREMLVTCAVK